MYTGGSVTLPFHFMSFRGRKATVGISCDAVGCPKIKINMEYPGYTMLIGTLIDDTAVLEIAPPRNDTAG